MLGFLLGRIFGSSRERYIKKLRPWVDAVNGLEPRYVAMSDDQLRAQTSNLKDRLAQGATLVDLLPESFAVVRETAKRVIGMRHFDVQIIGGVVLHQGSIAEMVTGEGKTLVATLPLYLNALEGRGVHLVTVNDYLARRDREWMGPIFEFLGLTVGTIQQGMGTRERQVAYRADITYGTNNEYGFDYLRDNMAIRPEHRVQRGHRYAIVDEVDSILVDEARTPLIISGRPEKSTDLYVKVDEAVRKLRKGKHFEAEEKGHHIIMTEEGMSTIERLMGVEDLYADDRLGIVHMVEQSLKAHNFYKRDDEYVVREGEVLIVDEFTGRLMEGRRYSDGLHQSIEAKERVAIQFESQTVATVTYQNFFKMYTKLAGMTGTAVTEASEFAEIYNLDVVQIPTNLPMQREDRTDLVFGTELGKFKYVVNEIAEIHKTGRPALVGTVSIEKSELVAKLLKELGITEFEVLNAKHHEREAAIVANAGKRDAITIATNMAGRGTDIKLGEGVAELGGLAIIGTERHDSRRIDNQLRGRCGRQGDLGTTRFYVSLEDEVARLFGGNRVKRIIDMLGGEQLDEQPLDQRMVTRSIQRAQRNVEEYNFEIRKHLLKYDDVMNKQRQVIYGLRQDVLEDRDVTAQLHEMTEDIVADAVSTYAAETNDPEQWDLEGLDARMRAVFGYSPDLGPDAQGEGTLDESIVRQVLEEYARREALISDEICNQFRAQIGGDESNVNFKKIARKRVHDYEMMALLQAVDDKWIQHLYDMDYLRESVRLRAYGQKDPLIEYKTEGFEMFEAMMMNISETVLRTLFRVTDPEFRKVRHLQARQAAASTENDPFDQLAQYSYVGAEKEADRSFTSYDTSRFALAGQPAAPQAVAAGAGNVATVSPSAPRAKPRPIRRVGEKTGPNDPCTCGSGKKYKKCCGAAQN